MTPISDIYDCFFILKSDGTDGVLCRTGKRYRIAHSHTGIYGMRGERETKNVNTRKRETNKWNVF